MADISDINAALPTKIVGSSSVGLEQTPVQSSAGGGLHTNLRDAAGVEMATTANPLKTTVSWGGADAVVTPSVIDLGSAGLAVRPIPYEPPTYAASISGGVMPATPTDIFNIIGSATKKIRITKIRVTGTTTSGSPLTVSASLVRRSTLNTGGTRTNLVEVPYDSLYSAATADVGFYTANPTALGTSVGIIRANRISFNVSGVTGGDVLWDFQEHPIVLRGTTQQLCINMNGTTVTGNIVSISIEWQEV